MVIDTIKGAYHAYNFSGHVERYLERTFYDLTSVALHDSNTYVEMSLLANHKYGLTLCDSRLPSLMLDQGLDVLFVARNIGAFVETYHYNLNEQVPDDYFSYFSKNGFEFLSCDDFCAFFFFECAFFY